MNDREGELHDMLGEVAAVAEAREARMAVLENRCERLFAVATALQDEAMLCHDGISAHVNFEAWEAFTHDMSVLWRERVGERIVNESGIYLDG